MYVHILIKLFCIYIFPLLIVDVTINMELNLHKEFGFEQTNSISSEN